VFALPQYMYGMPRSPAAYTLSATLVIELSAGHDWPVMSQLALAMHMHDQQRLRPNANFPFVLRARSKGPSPVTDRTQNLPSEMC
jgi:hypothetical protein